MLKHNVYFDGQVQSVGFERDGRRATVGVIAAGPHRFDTGTPERMTVISGEVRANVAGRGWTIYPPGSAFEIPAKSSFEVEALAGPAAYLCEFL